MSMSINMENIIQHSRAIILILLLPIGISCKKEFLEILPKGKLIAQTTNDYQLALGSLDLINMNTNGQIPMGDEVAAVNPYFTGANLRTQRLFRWDDVIYQPNEDAPELNVPMTNIYLFNKIINEVMNSADGTDIEKRSVRAQARAGRAWTYFLLINYYGKPYNATTAGTDPGFPIIVEADVNETTFSRASVQEVYDFIIDDLTASMADLPSKITHRILMSKPAAEGLLGKIYAFMGNYDKALPLLTNCIDAIAAAEIPVTLYDYNVSFAPGGVFLPIGLLGANIPIAINNHENIYAKQAFNTWAFGLNEFVITQSTAELYGSSDMRLNCFSATPYPSGAVFPNGMLRRTSPGSAHIGVVVPDIYLLMAECKARLGDLEAATTDLETFRSNRMPASDALVPPDVATDKVSLVRFILEERLREFALTGYRWFDMRRLSTDPEYSDTIGTTHQVLDGDGNIVDTYTLKPERLVMRFPQKLMDQNPGMENNP